MKVSLDCFPCFVRQALDAARIFSRDPAVHLQILREVLGWARDFDMDLPSPTMGQRVQRRLRELAGVEDPYREAKDLHNRMAASLLSEMEVEIGEAADPLLMAVRLAISGNVIDMGVNGRVTEADVRTSVHHALARPFSGEEQEAFRAAVAGARRILYLTDNAGEIAFDRLLIERLAPARVTVAVRGAPILNDATMVDARAVGLHEIAEVIDNGSDAPGTFLAECSPELRRHFAEADLVISKGMGNLESLSDEAGNIFFLLQVKCPVVARQVHAPLGTHLLMRGRGPASR